METCSGTQRADGLFYLLDSETDFPSDGFAFSDAHGDLESAFDLEFKFGPTATSFQHSEETVSPVVASATISQLTSFGVDVSGSPQGGISGNLPVTASDTQQPSKRFPEGPSHPPPAPGSNNLPYQRVPGSSQASSLTEKAPDICSTGLFHGAASGGLDASASSSGVLLPHISHGTIHAQSTSCNQLPENLSSRGDCSGEKLVAYGSSGQQHQAPAVAAGCSPQSSHPQDLDLDAFAGDDWMMEHAAAAAVAEEGPRDDDAEARASRRAGSLLQAEGSEDAFFCQPRQEAASTGAAKALGQRDVASGNHCAADGALAQVPDPAEAVEDAAFEWNEHDPPLQEANLHTSSIDPGESFGQPREAVGNEMSTAPEPHSFPSPVVPTALSPHPPSPGGVFSTPRTRNLKPPLPHAHLGSLPMTQPGARGLLQGWDPVGSHLHHDPQQQQLEVGLNLHGPSSGGGQGGVLWSSARSNLLPRLEMGAADAGWAVQSQPEPERCAGVGALRSLREGENRPPGYGNGPLWQGAGPEAQAATAMQSICHPGLDSAPSVGSLGVGTASSVREEPRYSEDHCAPAVALASHGAARIPAAPANQYGFHPDPHEGRQPSLSVARPLLVPSLPSLQATSSNRMAPLRLPLPFHRGPASAAAPAPVGRSSSAAGGHSIVASFSTGQRVDGTFADGPMGHPAGPPVAPPNTAHPPAFPSRHAHPSPPTSSRFCVVASPPSAAELQRLNGPAQEALQAQGHGPGSNSGFGGPLGGAGMHSGKSAHEAGNLSSLRNKWMSGPALPPLDGSPLPSNASQLRGRQLPAPPCLPVAGTRPVVFPSGKQPPLNPSLQESMAAAAKVGSGMAHGGIGRVAMQPAANGTQLPANPERLAGTQPGDCVQAAQMSKDFQDGPCASNPQKRKADDTAEDHEAGRPGVFKRICMPLPLGSPPVQQEQLKSAPCSNPANSQETCLSGYQARQAIGGRGSSADGFLQGQEGGALSAVSWKTPDSGSPRGAADGSAIEEHLQAADQAAEGGGPSVVATQPVDLMCTESELRLSSDDLGDDGEGDDQEEEKGRCGRAKEPVELPYRDEVKTTAAIALTTNSGRHGASNMGKPKQGAVGSRLLSTSPLSAAAGNASQLALEGSSSSEGSQLAGAILVPSRSTTGKPMPQGERRAEEKNTAARNGVTAQRLPISVEEHTEEAEEEDEDERDDDHGGLSTGSGGSGSSKRKKGFVQNAAASAARKRRHDMSQRLRYLVDLVPNSSKGDTASMLLEVIEYVQTLVAHITHSLGADLATPSTGDGAALVATSRHAQHGGGVASSGGSGGDSLLCRSTSCISSCSPSQSEAHQHPLGAPMAQAGCADRGQVVTAACVPSRAEEQSMLPSGPGDTLKCSNGPGTGLSQSTLLQEMTGADTQSLAVSLRLPPGVQPSARALQAAKFRLRRRMLAAKQDMEKRQGCNPLAQDGQEVNNSKSSDSDQSDKPAGPRKSLTRRGFSLVHAPVGEKFRDCCIQLNIEAR